MRVVVQRDVVHHAVVKRGTMVADRQVAVVVTIEMTDGAGTIVTDVRGL